MVTIKELMRSRARGVNSKKKQLLAIKICDGRYTRSRIKTIGDRPIWHLMRDFINGFSPGEIFTRLDLLNAIYDIEIGKHMRRSSGTVDTYLRCVKVVLCIESAGIGKYKKLKNIPDDLSISKLQNHIDNGTWETWFIPVEDI